MSDQMLHHALAERRPRSGADPLLEFLCEAQDMPVTIHAGSVARLDSLRLRSLLAARARWQAQGLPFRVENASPAFRAGLEELGLPATHFEPEES